MLLVSPFPDQTARITSVRPRSRVWASSYMPGFGSDLPQVAGCWAQLMGFLAMVFKLWDPGGADFMLWTSILIYLQAFKLLQLFGLDYLSGTLIAVFGYWIILICILTRVVDSSFDVSLAILAYLIIKYGT